MFSYGTGRVMICLTKIQFFHMSRWPVMNVVILRTAQVCPTLFVVVVCFLVTSNWMQQLKFNVHYAHSKLKSLPMGQIILPRNILKKALGFLQVDFFFLTRKMTYSTKNIYWTIMKSAKSLNCISHSMADDNIQHVQFSPE